MLVRRKIRRLLTYNNITGIVETKCKLTLQSIGYMRIKIDKTSYKLIDVIYILVHGEIPEYAKVIHLNNNKMDFRLVNLGLDMSRLKKEKELLGIVERRKQRELLKPAKEKAQREKVERRNVRILKARDKEETKLYFNQRRIDITKVDKK